MKIKKILRLFIQEAVNGILEAKNQSHDRLVENFSLIEFVTKEVDSDENNTRIELQLTNNEEYFRLISGEAINFSLAALASTQRAKQNQNKNAAWGVVEQYYAAYYSIHFLMRMCGISITNIDKSIVKRIRECSIGINVPDTIPLGLYRFEYVGNSEKLVLQKMPKGGGSHKEAWKEWEKIVTRLKNNAAVDINEYADADSLLSAHLEFFVRTPDRYYNAPDIRSEINYQFSNETWFFENITDARVSNLNSKINSDNYIFHSADEKIIKFTANNAIILLLARHMFDHLVEHYPRGIYRNINNKHRNAIRLMS